MDLFKKLNDFILTITSRNENFWEQRKLLKVCKKEDNKRIPIKEQERKEGNTPYFGANGIQGYIDGYTHDGTNILIAEDGANNVKNYPIKLITGKIWVNNHAHVLNVNTKTNNGNFLVGAIKKINFYRYLVGSSRYKLTAESLSQVKIEITEQSEQEKIGELFKSIEELLTLYERKIKLFDDMIAYLKQQLFYKQSSLSFPQSHWKDIAFSKLYIKRKDKNIDASYDQSKTISVANMKYSDRELNSSREYLKTYYITHFGDIIYEGNRSGNFKYGRFVQNNIGDGIVSHVFTVYKPINDLDINFMNNFINYEPIMSRVLLYATTDTLMMHTLHDNELMKQKLSLPDKETQIKIGKILSLVSTIKNRFSERKELLIKIKNTLLNTMFI